MKLNKISLRWLLLLVLVLIPILSVAALPGQAGEPEPALGFVDVVLVLVAVLGNSTWQVTLGNLLKYIPAWQSGWSQSLYRWVQVISILVVYLLLEFGVLTPSTYEGVVGQVLSVFDQIGVYILGLIPFAIAAGQWIYTQIRGLRLVGKQLTA